MEDELVTNEQKKLLMELYGHVEVYGLSPGTFRGKYDMGLEDEKWTVDDTLSLQKLGFISINEPLLMASIVSPNITDTGRSYVNKLELNF
jgi:hypothetical protein